MREELLPTYVGYVLDATLELQDSPRWLPLAADLYSLYSLRCCLRYRNVGKRMIL